MFTPLRRMVKEATRQSVQVPRSMNIIITDICNVMCLVTFVRQLFHNSLRPFIHMICIFEQLFPFDLPQEQLGTQNHQDGIIEHFEIDSDYFSYYLILVSADFTGHDFLFCLCRPGFSDKLYLLHQKSDGSSLSKGFYFSIFSIEQAVNMVTDNGLNLNRL